MKESTVKIDSIIECLANAKPNQQFTFTEAQIKGICTTARKIFMDQPILLELTGPINVVGDIHGQFYDLLKIFRIGLFPPQANYLFLGDYVDRGKMSIQTMLLLLCFKIKYPENFFLLRGNHEAAEINKIYGFYQECKRKYSLKIWKLFTDLFNTLPLCALIDDKILCMHGGIGPDFNKVSEILKINRPTDIPQQGIMCDLLWSDPNETGKGFRQNVERGIGTLFGADVLEKFLDRNNLDLICRSHQIVEEGYEFFAKRQLVTVFSAPNYCGIFQNQGAMMKVDKDLICSFQILKSEEKVKQKKKIKNARFVN